MIRAFCIIKVIIVLVGILFLAWLAFSVAEVAFRNMFNICNDNSLNFFSVLLSSSGR